MTTKLSSASAAVKELFNEVDNDIRSFVEAIDVNELSKYNAGYRRYTEDKFSWFIEAEKPRFAKAISLIDSYRISPGQIFDLGCFIPYLPLALKKLGHSVRIADKYSLYSPAMRELVFSFAAEHALEIDDIDIVNDNLSGLGGHDVVMLMAVVEHLNGSPVGLMKNIRSLLKEDGVLLFEVPNLAEFSKRIGFLFGRSPLPPYEDYLDSAYPFSGHNREMTMDEVYLLMRKTGYRVNTVECYDYDFRTGRTWRTRTVLWLKRIIPMGNKGASIFVTAEKGECSF